MTQITKSLTEMLCSISTLAFWNLLFNVRAYVELRTLPSLDISRYNEVSHPLHISPRSQWIHFSNGLLQPIQWDEF